MGTDIHGTVEFKSKGKWIVHESLQVSRNANMFDVLFGTGNRAYLPIAYARGIPPDSSSSTKKSAAELTDKFGETYIVLKEINEMDWKQYRGNSFEVVTVFKRSWFKGYRLINSFSGYKLYDHEPPDNLDHKDLYELAVFGEIKRGSFLYTYKAKPVPHPLEERKDWKDLFSQMNKLGKKYGEENVRIVAWFEN